MGTGAMFTCCGSAETGAMLESPSLFTATILGVNQSYVLRYLFVTDERDQVSFQLKFPESCRVSDLKMPVC